MATSLTLQNDASLAQGYVKVNGTTSATFTTSGITGNLTGNVTGSLTAGGSLTLATAQTASGTSVDFTGIPSWVKRITVMFRGVSTSSTSDILIRLGTSSGVTTTGYATYGLRTGSTAVTSGANSTVGFAVVATAAANVYSGSVIFSALGGDIWTGFGLLADSAGGNGYIITGGISLAATLDRVRITTVNGTDTFDGGTINISFEG